ncbi:hypothetical protein ScPMuIL_017970 [Solemya velum]
MVSLHIVIQLALIALVAGSGTTPHIREIFLGRCWAYQEVIKPQHLHSDVKNCELLWDMFVTAFSNKGPCDVTSQEYAPFMSQASQEIARNKAMFWSGTYQIAHQFAENGKRFVTLEDTLIGYIVNSVTWCGDNAGINYMYCPPWYECAEAGTAFWGSASSEFASSARGNITIVLDGSRDGKPAYSKDSYFAKFELPALRLPDVTRVNILLVHDIDKPRREMCDNGSLLSLQDDIAARGLKSTCVDDPDTVIHLMCVDDPESRECQLVHKMAHNSQQKEAILNARPKRSVVNKFDRLHRNMHPF